MGTALELRSAEGEARRVKSLPKGRKHWNWNDSASILALHKRIHRKYGRAKDHPCANACGRQALDWAFIGKGKYSDRLRDYKPLCRKCHIALDKHWSKVDRTRHRIIRDAKGRIISTIIV